METLRPIDAEITGSNPVMNTMPYLRAKAGTLISRKAETVYSTNELFVLGNRGTLIMLPRLLTNYNIDVKSVSIHNFDSTALLLMNS